MLGDPLTHLTRRLLWNAAGLVRRSSGKWAGHLTLRTEVVPALGRILDAPLEQVRLTWVRAALEVTVTGTDVLRWRWMPDVLEDHC